MFTVPPYAHPQTIQHGGQPPDNEVANIEDAMHAPPSTDYSTSDYPLSLGTDFVEN